jgi:hypothetical protein
MKGSTEHHNCYREFKLIRLSHTGKYLKPSAHLRTFGCTKLQLICCWIDLPFLSIKWSVSVGANHHLCQIPGGQFGHCQLICSILLCFFTIRWWYLSFLLVFLAVWVFFLVAVDESISFRVELFDFDLSTGRSTVLVILACLLPIGSLILQLIQLPTTTLYKPLWNCDNKPEKCTCSEQKKSKSTMSSRSFCMPPSDPIHVRDLLTLSKIVSHN